MNKSFVLLDKVNNLQKTANGIVKFNFEEKDYLVYSTQENEQNSQIFVSKFILNSEGKYFIDNISSEEKNKLSNIVYNIVILVPTDAQKGESFETLNNNLVNKFGVKLSLDIPNMEMQEYYSNSSIAITSKILVDAAVKLYSENLKNVKQESVMEIPTWTAPLEVTAPVDASVEVNNNVQSAPVSIIPEQTPVVPVDLTVSGAPVSEPVVSDQEVTPAVVDTVSDETITVENEEQLNPQLKKLAVVSDPSLSAIGINVQQPNVGKLKKAGFANTKYVVIGTICLVLAIAVVITAYILIKNMK